MPEGKPRCEVNGPERIVTLGYEGLVRCPSCKTTLHINLYALSGDDYTRCGCGAHLGISDGLVISAIGRTASEGTA